jgi:hypothetical protein
MWGVCHHINATGGNGCARRELFRFTSHGPLQKVQPDFL